MMTSKPGDAETQLLEVENLAISYETRHGDVAAVRGVNFRIGQGDIDRANIFAQNVNALIKMSVPFRGAEPSKAGYPAVW